MDWPIFFKLFLQNKELFFSFYELVPTGIFENPIQSNTFILIQKFADKHKRLPDFETLKLLLDYLPDAEKENKQAYINFLDTTSELKVDTIDIEVFEEQLTKAIQNYELEQFILKTANSIGKTDLETVVEDIRSITRKFVPKSFGLDVTDVNRAIKIIRHDTTSMVSTGIDDLDKVMRGGYGANELTIIMAPPGKGKSFALLNAMYYTMLAGKNALYITLELSEKSVLRRLYSRVTFSNRKDMLDEETISKRAKKFFSLATAQGRVIYYPGMSLSVNGIEALIEQQQLYFGFKPDIIIVDYLDRLAPRKNDFRIETRHQLRNISDDLRSLANKFGIPMLTATQANRASLSKLKITEANVSESFGKVEVADVVMALCQTDEERTNKRARLVMLKNREGTPGSTIEFYCSFDEMCLMDLTSAARLGLVVQPKQIAEIRTRPIGER